jgi:uncharacterized membrane protein (DUF2068 family)
VYTSKGIASIFAGWGAARLVELTGSWLPVLWTAFACNLLAAVLAFFCLKPMVGRITVQRRTDAAWPAHPPRLFNSR